MLEKQIIPTNPDEYSRCGEKIGEQFNDGTPHSTYKNRDDKQISAQNLKTDAALEEKITHALWKNDVLRATDYNEIEIHVKNDIVYLSGHLLSSTNFQRVEKALQTVDGIRSIRNNFVLDDELMRDVAESLGQLEKATNCKIFTGVSHGVVVLHGDVNTPNVRLSAELCAASNPKVRGVINYIRVPGVTLTEEDFRFLQPPIGKEICFLDGIFAIVTQVVINPVNRRVVAMIIQGRFLGLPQNLSTTFSGPILPAQQLLLVPMSVVGHLTNSSGFLTISSTDNKKVQKFDPCQFCAPAKDWIPPYPYCPQDVLLPLGSQQLPVISEPVPAQVSSTQLVEEQVLTKQLLTNDSLGG